MGRVPAPEVGEAAHLIELLFKLGPVRGEMPLSEADLEPWERRRGVDLNPWEAELLVQMSQEYMQQMHLSKQPSTLSPWPKARGMWKYVQDELHKRSQKAEQEKEPPRNGNRKRR